ncbi:MAG TPA: DUF4259 domain-containing protein [Gaiellaceae bacterium]|nr:DUF4259 domain-containing protein [Gaiellaceae bacterium]
MNWNTLRGTLQAACEEPASAEVAERAIEAAEIVASAAGEPPDKLPREAREWVETHGVPDPDLVELAYRAMKCVADASGDARDRLNDLRFRLGDIAAA